MKNYSNYHEIDTNNKISQDGLLLLQHSMNGFEGYDVEINNVPNKRVLIYQKYDSQGDNKKVIGMPDDIEIGNIISLENQSWLVVTYPEYNKIYKKAEIQLCNSTFQLKGDKTEILLGYDSYGRPVYKTEYGEDKVVPCITETKTYRDTSSESIQLPQGQIIVTLQYTQSESIKINEEFMMYDSKWKIIDLDYTKVINDKGLITITAERVVND